MSSNNQNTSDNLLDNQSNPNNQSEQQVRLPDDTFIITSSEFDANLTGFMRSPFADPNLASQQSPPPGFRLPPDPPSMEDPTLEDEVSPYALRVDDTRNDDGEDRDTGPYFPIKPSLPRRHRTPGARRRHGTPSLPRPSDVPSEPSVPSGPSAPSEPIAPSKPNMPSEPSASSADDLRPSHPNMLSHNEVAAVSADREVYVSDEPSPYLSARTAKEDPQDTKRRHSLFVIVCALLCVAAATGGITWLLLSALKPSEILDVPTFDTIAIQAGEFVESIDTTALTQPLDERAVMPDVSGSIREVLTQEGAYVTEGDVLFQLDNPNITDAAAKAQETYNKVLAEADAKLAALNEANSALDNARAALEDAKTNAERITAQAAYDAALKHAEIVQTESNAAEATLQTVTETNNQAQAQLSTLVVHAPISGTITELNPGAVKSANVTGTTRLCVVSDMSSFRLQIEVPEQSRSRVNEGQLVKLKFPSIPDLETSSVISSIDYVGDLNVATVFIENPDERIQRGTAVETSIIVQSVPDSLMVPNEAIRIDEKGLAHLDILLDPTRGIHSDVVVTIIAQDSAHAAVQASNIQEGNAAIIGSGGEPEQVTEGTA